MTYLYDPIHKITAVDARVPHHADKVENSWVYTCYTLERIRPTHKALQFDNSADNLGNLLVLEESEVLKLIFQQTGNTSVFS